jgi:DNA-binding MarR family transcriptional regulator
MLYHTTMTTEKINENHREILEIMTGLAHKLRCCKQDEAFCADVTFHQFVILDSVAKKGEIFLADLHKILAVEKSTTTRLVNPLIQKGLLLRDKASHDSRAVRLIMTEEGIRIHENVWACMANYFEGVMCNIPESKRQEVLECVKIFINALGNSNTDCGCSEKQ